MQSFQLWNRGTPTAPPPPQRRRLKTPQTLRSYTRETEIPRPPAAGAADGGRGIRRTGGEVVDLRGRWKIALSVAEEGRRPGSSSLTEHILVGPKDFFLSLYGFRIKIFFNRTYIGLVRRKFCWALQDHYEATWCWLGKKKSKNFSTLLWMHMAKTQKRVDNVGWVSQHMYHVAGFDHVSKARATAPFKTFWRARSAWKPSG
jgi:hypothetical protein